MKFLFTMLDNWNFCVNQGHLVSVVDIALSNSGVITAWKMRCRICGTEFVVPTREDVFQWITDEEVPETFETQEGENMNSGLDEIVEFARERGFQVGVVIFSEQDEQVDPPDGDDDDDSQFVMFKVTADKAVMRQQVGEDGKGKPIMGIFEYPRIRKDTGEIFPVFPTEVIATGREWFYEVAPNYFVEGVRLYVQASKGELLG